MKKTITTILLACTMILPNTVGVFANEINENTILETNISNTENLEIQEEVEPHLNYDNTVYLSTNSWNNVINDNNWLNAKLKVTNSSMNPGSISVRIIDENGKIIVSSTSIGLGKTVTLDKISFAAGEFYVQAKAQSESGSYIITIKD